MKNKGLTGLLPVEAGVASPGCLSISNYMWGKTDWDEAEEPGASVTLGGMGLLCSRLDSPSTEQYQPLVAGYITLAQQCLDLPCPSSTHIPPGTSLHKLLASQPPSHQWGACGILPLALGQTASYL